MENPNSWKETIIPFWQDEKKWKKARSDPAMNPSGSSKKMSCRRRTFSNSNKINDQRSHFIVTFSLFSLPLTFKEGWISRPGNSPSGVRIKLSSNEWRLNALEHNSASGELRNCIFWLWLLFTYTNNIITVLALGFLEVMQFLHRGQCCFNLKPQTLP